jgi:hypothetical protein
VTVRSVGRESCKIVVMLPNPLWVVMHFSVKNLEKVAIIRLKKYFVIFLSMIDAFAKESYKKKSVNYLPRAITRNILYRFSWNFIIQKFIQSYWACFGLYPSSCMWKTKDHNVSETGSVSVLRWMGQDKSTQLGPLERASLNHWNDTPSSESFEVYLFKCCL